MPGSNLTTITEEDDNFKGGIDCHRITITFLQTLRKEAVIDQLQSCQKVLKNLGIFTTLEGSPDPQIESLRGRVDK